MEVSLARHAIKAQRATRVEVNEQNEQVLGYYAHLSFTAIRRFSLDGQGNHIRFCGWAHAQSCALAYVKTPWRVGYVLCN
ncbi:hypothetical protein [Cernens ardua]|uniref:hypothetical protein n=1 Tax=Cernens ardua TaxID=3402176 RepID=UPI003F992122